MIALSLWLLGMTALVLVLLLWPLRKQRRACLVVAGVVTAFSALVYAAVGAPRLMPELAAYHEQMQQAMHTIATAQARLAEHPDDLEATLTWAQAHLDLRHFPAAIDGFKRAVLISKGHPRIIMAYAEALILQQGGVVSEQAKKSIDIALMLDETLPLARYYQAVWLLQEGENEQAMQMMKQLYTELPDDSPLKRRMKAEIGR